MDGTTYPFPNFNGVDVEVLNGYVISYRTLLGMWSFIHARIKVAAC